MQKQTEKTVKRILREDFDNASSRADAEEICDSIEDLFGWGDEMAVEMRSDIEIDY